MDAPFDAQSATLSRFCPLAPTDKQRQFLSATQLEVLFGGAAGGGKSIALLMAALQHVHVPGYSALILRKDTQRLALAGGLIPRSHEWLAGKHEATWNAARRQWSFDTGAAPATISFGYLATPLDKFRYASSEYQLIAFDELTELAEADYLFLFSRLRKAHTLGVPLAMRSASNPGNIGHAWVKERFVERTGDSGYRLQGSETSSQHNPEPRTQSPDADRLFIPSRIVDNPHLDAAAYRRSLVHLPPVERERLLAGDWSIQDRALIHADWLRYYTLTRRASGAQLTRRASEEEPSSRFQVSSYTSAGNMQPETWNLEPETLNLEPETLNLLSPDGRLLAAVDPAGCRRFVTVDPAGTSAERAAELRGRPRSFTVCQVWDQPRGDLARFLLLRHQVRGHFSWTEIRQALTELSDRWRPERIWIENERLGVALVDQLRGLPVAAIPTRGRDKAVRATRLLHKLAAGEVFLPRYENSWRHDFEKELLSWTGDNREMTDQIDAAAYAAIVADTGGPGILTLQPVVARV
jgi:phage terminase large subunit-like protein